MEIQLTNSVTDLASIRPVTRSPQQVAQARINEVLASIDNMNKDGRLAGLMFVGLASSGDHVMGLAGQEDVSVLDLLALLELHRQCILVENGYDENGSPSNEQPDLFGEDLWEMPE